MSLLMETFRYIKVLRDDGKQFASRASRSGSVLSVINIKNFKTLDELDINSVFHDFWYD